MFFFAANNGKVRVNKNLTNTQVLLTTSSGEEGDVGGYVRLQISPKTAIELANQLLKLAKELEPHVTEPKIDPDLCPHCKNGIRVQTGDCPAGKWWFECSTCGIKL
jgi:hypothetical protein